MTVPVLAASPRTQRRDDVKTTRWVGFEMSGQRYALDIAKVREVLSSAFIEPVPGAPPVVLGVINLRGRIVTVIDLHMRLDLPSSNSEESCVVVVDVDGEPLALRVDRITELHTVAEGAIKPAPRAANAGPDRIIRGLVSRDSNMLTLLDLDALVTTLV